MEAVPTTLEGHFQEIECLISGGLYIISSCLLGEIRVWNSSDGELVTHINRQKYFSSAKNSSEFLTTESDHLSDYESGSPPSVGEVDISSYQVKTSNRGISNDSSVHNLVSSVFNERGVYNRKKQKSDISVKPNLNFSKLKLHEQNGDPSKYKNGFDFETPLKMLAMEKRNSSIEELVGSSEKSVFLVNGTCERLENQGITSGNGDNWNSLVNSTLVAELCANDERGIGKNSVTPIWCIDCLDNLIAVGCSNGQIEFWECLTGKLQVISFFKRIIGFNK